MPYLSSVHQLPNEVIHVIYPVVSVCTWKYFSTVARVWYPLLFLDNTVDDMDEDPNDDFTAIQKMTPVCSYYNPAAILNGASANMYTSVRPHTPSQYLRIGGSFLRCFRRILTSVRYLTQSSALRCCVNYSKKDACVVTPSPSYIIYPASHLNSVKSVLVDFSSYCYLRSRVNYMN